MGAGTMSVLSGEGDPFFGLLQADSRPRAKRRGIDKFARVHIYSKNKGKKCRKSLQLWKKMYCFTAYYRLSTTPCTTSTNFSSHWVIFYGRRPLCAFGAFSTIVSSLKASPIILLVSLIARLVLRGPLSFFIPISSVR